MRFDPMQASTKAAFTQVVRDTVLFVQETARQRIVALVVERCH